MIAACNSRNEELTVFSKGKRTIWLAVYGDFYGIAFATGKEREKEK